MQEHLDVCGACRAVAAEAMRSVTSVTDEDAPLVLTNGMCVSRYEVLDVIGVGALGVVYRAYDPELQRTVALKMVRAGASSPGGREEAHDRLLREARTMARLSHPNVVNVYDAGSHEGQIFLIMEIVEGETLATWLREQPSWQEVLDAFQEAGLGLAAAHAANFIHGDFKPENVLVSSDRRIRVTDFGLAKSVDPSAPLHTSGTPAYMAPEQFLGLPVDPRTDQFSFCVALYVALYGQYPFGDDIENVESLEAICKSVTAGKIRSVAPDTTVPAGLHAILKRGLSVASEHRYSSMLQLLADLRRARLPQAAPRRRRANIAVSLVTVLGISTIIFALTRGRSSSGNDAIRCGDGILQAGENCDDGNPSDEDGCLTNCQFGTCGDGKIRRYVEECDDGNMVDEDGCNTRCLACRSGKASFTWAENGHCYSRHDAPATWNEARNVCGRSAGDLVTYDEHREMAAIHRGILDRTTIPVWIGLFNDRWITGDPLEVTPHNSFEAPWASPEPQRKKLGCVFQYAEGFSKSEEPPILWDVADCARPFGFVCEQEGWVVRGEDNHAYLAVSRPTSWNDARAACAERGGHLATLGSSPEQDFVAASRHWSREMWIGGTDSVQEGTFEWITSEAFGFTVFAPGEPDNNESTSHCLVLGPRRGWHDRPCDREYAYLCEID